MLRSVNPYDHIEEEAKRLGLEEDLQSWPSRQSPIFQELIEELRPENIVELGSWKGGSAIRMAEICDQLKLETKIHCVDTWLGSAEHFDGKPRDYLFPVDVLGTPLLYQQFLLNVKLNGHETRIIPYRNTASHLAILFGKQGKKAELIYVDGPHDYESVYQDLCSYALLLTDKKSVLFGDDYHLDSVRAAVIRFAFEFQFSVQYIKESNHFVLRQK